MQHNVKAHGNFHVPVARKRAKVWCLEISITLKQKKKNEKEQGNLQVPLTKECKGTKNKNFHLPLAEECKETGTTEPAHICLL